LRKTDGAVSWLLQCSKVQILVFNDILTADQCPVHIPAEERIDAGVTPIGVRSTAAEFSPPANPWHELDVEQVRKAKHRRRLPVRVGMQASGL
jgi:hypothetical protein